MYVSASAHAPFLSRVSALIGKENGKSAVSRRALKGKRTRMKGMKDMRKIAAVTGAGAGIGRGIAIELAKAGYDLLIHSATHFDRAEQLCEELRRDFGAAAFAVQADLLDPAAPKRIFEAFDKHFDHIDLFVNNAGITEGAPFLSMTRETVDRVTDIDLKGSYFCVQEAARRMVKNHTEGCIVIIVSNQKDFLMPKMSIYGPVKSALDHFAKHASMELAPYKIRVNTIAPGWVDSSERLWPYRESSLKQIPLKRWATVSEVGQAVLYLASPQAGFITGSCLTMDGGAVNKYFDMEDFAQEEE